MSVPPGQTHCTFIDCGSVAASSIGAHAVCAEHGAIALERLARLLGLTERELVAVSAVADGRDG